MNAHLAAQRAVVRMMFDPLFADAARRDPERVLAALPPALRAQLAGVDPRAFGLDPLRRRRALRVIAEEWKATTTLILSETRSLAALEGFFGSSAFHRAVEERGSMPLAFATWVAGEITEGKLASPALLGVLAIETALAQSRRQSAVDVDESPSSDASNQSIAVAAGVVAIEVTAGALAALHACERYLFEVGLMPAVALCDDAPRVVLDARCADATPLHLITVPHAGGVTLVTIDDDHMKVLAAIESGAHSVARVIEESSARGVAADRARDIVAELLDGEIVVRE
jgi:hypothetical protein